jgi:hypothetical protein
MWLLGSPDTVILSVHLASDVDCGIVGDQSFHETIFLHFQLHLLAKFTPFHLVCWCRGCTNRIFYDLKHSRLPNAFHTVIFGMANSLLPLAIDLRAFSETPRALFQCCHQPHDVIQDSCLYRSIQLPQTVGTAWLFL